MIRHKRLLAISILGFLLSTAAPIISQAETPHVEWIQQFGTSNHDVAHDVWADNQGHIYVAGETDLTSEDPYIHPPSAFLTKYNTGGSELWSVQLNATRGVGIQSVSTDANGNAYVTGMAGSGVNGTDTIGRHAFISKYNVNGTKLWTSTFGISENDIDTGHYPESISVDALGNAYITGWLERIQSGVSSLTGLPVHSLVRDAFLTKYDADGTNLWMESISTSSHDRAHGVSVDALGNAYITGSRWKWTDNIDSVNDDVFLTKFDTTGRSLWTRDFDTNNEDVALDISADATGNVYITGTTNGNFGGQNIGEKDAFLVKYDTDGTELWGNQFGTNREDMAFGVSLDSVGNAYVAGFSGEFLGPYGTIINTDTFLTKFDTSGIELWTTEIKTNNDDFAFSVSVDASGTAYLTGATLGDLSGSSTGASDVFIAKISVPEPASCVLIILGSILFLIHQKYNSRRIE